MNRLTHRDQHHRAARPGTGEELRAIRHAVAAQRREEQRLTRIAAGTDRATLRARRTAAP